MLWLKEQLKGTLIIAAILVVLAFLFQSGETALFFVSTLAFHELGHMLPILLLGIPSYLTILILGVATVSDMEGRSRLTEFQNGLIHLGGPAFNLLLALAALAMHARFGQETEYWLRLANTNALIGFVNLLVFGHASDGGKYIHRLFASMPEFVDDVITLIAGIISVLTLALVALTKGTESLPWIGLVTAWVIVSMFKMDKEDDLQGFPRKPMKIWQAAVSFAVYVGITLVMLAILLATPFLISQAQAYQIVVNFLRLLITVALNGPLLLTLIVFFLALTVPHELGHFFAAKTVKIGIKRFVLGKPDNKPVIRLALMGIPFEIYRLPLMAAVDTDDDSLMRSSFRATTWFALAGPLVNILLAAVVLIGSTGLATGLAFTGYLLQSMFQLVGSFLFGWLGLFGGSQFFFEAFGPIRELGGLYGINEIVLVFAMLQVFIAVVNLLPIPGLDGGWILMALIIKVRTRWQTTDKVEAITKLVYNAWVSFATKKLTRIVIGGAFVLSLIHFAVYYLL